jgi:hypothetical protein
MLFVPMPPELVKVAAPPERLPAPRMLVPLIRKVTVPDGCTPGPVTVEVKVMDWPVAAGFAEDARIFVVTALVTARVATADVADVTPHAPEPLMTHWNSLPLFATIVAAVV